MECNCSDLVADVNVARSPLRHKVCCSPIQTLSPLHPLPSPLSLSHVLQLSLSVGPVRCVIIDFALHFSSTFPAFHSQRVILFGFIFHYPPLSFKGGVLLCANSLSSSGCVCVCAKFWRKSRFWWAFCVSFRFVRHESVLKGATNKPEREWGGMGQFNPTMPEKLNSQFCSTCTQYSRGSDRKQREASLPPLKSFQQNVPMACRLDRFLEGGNRITREGESLATGYRKSWEFIKFIFQGEL